MERVDEILTNKTVRITAMRQLVLEYFLENDGTFGLLELENDFPKSDRITIYRTLKTFEQKGIVHGISNGTGEVKYALCDEYCTTVSHIDRHPHFQCERCEQISCIDSQLIPKVELPKGYLQKEITMMIKGVCPNCLE
jgi:Fur family ferric uptake transcriptional regulator